MASPGIWVRWRHEKPPVDTVIEARYEYDVDRILTGKRCRSGCCLDLDAGYDVIAPDWWRLPEPQPAESK